MNSLDVIELDSNSSEITKLVSNAFLGQRISSINTLTELCEVSQANVNNSMYIYLPSLVSDAVGMDSRIGKTYLKASMGFGGSCLKKDILSLIYIFSSRNLDIQANYWSQVVLFNEYQRIRISRLITNSAISTNEEPRVSIFGLSFKGNTNDVRGSNSVFLISYLIKNKINVSLYDPYVKKEEFENELKLYDSESDEMEDNKYISYYESHIDAVKDSNVLVFCNNHSLFSGIDLDCLNKNMRQPSYIYDLYDIFDVETLKESEFKVFKLGVFSNV